MSLPKKIFLFLVSILYLSINCGAVMPGQFFQAREKKSKIKAIAIVKNVKITDYNKKRGIATQKVTFETVTPLIDKDLPKIFTGYCYSMVEEKGWIGGEMYYYPKYKLGKHVYVAVTKNNGTIAAFHSVSEKEIKELIDKFKNKNLLLGQINIKDRVDSISKVFNNWYIFKVDDKELGYLQHKKNDFSLQVYVTHLFINGENPIEKYSVKASFSDNAEFSLDKINLKNTNAKGESKSIWLKFDNKSSKQLVEGILRKSGQYTIQKNTLSDFVLFNIVTLLPFDDKQTLHFSVIESFELNVKNNIKLKFIGSDNGLFKFVQLDASDNIVAQYWLDEKHVLQRVDWDKNKQFIRTTQEDYYSKIKEDNNVKANDSGRSKSKIKIPSV